jgi:hypothetical protein
MPYNMTLHLAAVNGGVDYAMLADKAPFYSYQDGRRSDEPIGTKLVVALQGANLTPLTVKFDHDPLPRVTDEQIRAACEACQPLLVQLPDCEVSLYSSTGGGIGMSATAGKAQIVKLSDKG